MNDIFIQSMIVGAIFENKYSSYENVYDWTGSEECSTAAVMVIEYAKEMTVSLECAMDVVMDNLLLNGFSIIEDHMWDDYHRGFLAGQIIGFPTEENLNKVKMAEVLWKNEEIYGYYHEVLNEVAV